MSAPVFMQRPVIEIPDSHANTRKAARREFGNIKASILDESGAVIPLELFDLSATGAYLRSDLLLAPGDKVRLKLEIPSLDAAVELEAQVVRGDLFEADRGSGMGLTFESISDEARIALEACMTSKRSS